MTVRVLVPLAEGFEEIEAVTVIDVLRRATAEVVVAGLTEGPVRGSRNVTVVPDTTLALVLEDDFDAIVLPGGGQGAKNLAADTRVQRLLRQARDKDRLIGAICAAPAVVLQAHGFLDGKKSTCHPSFAQQVPGYQEQRVVTDGRLVTSQGPGTAMEFALDLVAKLMGAPKAEEVRRPMLVKQDSE